MVDWFKWKTIGIGGVGIGLVLTGIQLGLLVILQFFDWSTIPALSDGQMLIVFIAGLLFVYLGVFLHRVADERLEKRIQELREENRGESR
ncbi:hypothetical protein [Natrinema altunense]|uniref:Uncharacterized protein n=1 Tax=Natrinema altunense (strain JCM 12890 / CGMCC 1.3731 / AJ2) TaxID=1227494 RepID=L9ZDD2_NATA2|nr:hypothetical protein [Natrinema altunense]ELY83597.1 hypothetical protein C485_17632 [Natrinema altunense JCM 12890]